MHSADLLNHLWQSTVFAAAAGLLTLAFKKNRAPVRYWLWFAASCKFLIPFSLLVTIGSQFEWRTPHLPAPLPAASLTFVIEDLSQPFTPPTPTRSRSPQLLLSLWLCGLSIVAIGWLRQWHRVRAALRSASPLELNLPIRALSSPARLEPGVFGVFRPVLLLPDGIAERLTAVQMQAILTHELCHVRRRDNLTAAIHMLVEAIFWFHPLVWWIGKRLVDERERACDEAVLQTSCDPESYAEGLLNVCRLYLESPLRCISGVTGANLKKRVRDIMTQRITNKLDPVRKLLLAAAAMIAVAGPLAVGVLNAPPLVAQAPPQPAVQQITAPEIVAQNQPPPATAAPKPLLPATNPAPRGAQVNPSTYIIGAADVLYIEVKDQNFPTFHPIQVDGTFKMPLIGQIKADGLTPLQLTKQLTEALSKFLQAPVVSVKVYEVGQRSYFVVGNVKSPGQRRLIQPTTALEAIAAAGSFSHNPPDQTTITVHRSNGRFEFNYGEYLKGRNTDQNVLLRSGDWVVVE